MNLEGKGDRTAKGYKFICPVFWLDKTSLQQGLEKLSENRINGYSIQNNTNIKVECDFEGIQSTKDKVVVYCIFIFVLFWIL